MPDNGDGPSFETELHQALKSKDVGEALRIIQDNDTWSERPPMGILCTLDQFRTALHYAAFFKLPRGECGPSPEDKRWETVYAMLTERANAVINARDSRQQTALIVACSVGNIAMARSLLQSGANPNISVVSQGGYGHEGRIHRTSNVTI